jgi:hypothetical protein
MMEAASTSETVNVYQTTRRYNPEDHHLRTVSISRASAKTQMEIIIRIIQGHKTQNLSQSTQLSTTAQK